MNFNNYSDNTVLLFQMYVQEQLANILEEAYHTNGLGDNLFDVVYNIGSGFASALYECIEKKDNTIDQLCLNNVLTSINEGMLAKFNLLKNPTDKIITIHHQSNSIN